MWKKLFFDGICQFQQALDHSLWHILSVKQKCLIINVYNPCDAASRALVWQDLISICGSSELPCLFIGDFNEVLDAAERGSHFLSFNSSNDFKFFFAGT